MNADTLVRNETTFAEVIKKLSDEGVTYSSEVHENRVLVGYEDGICPTVLGFSDGVYTDHFCVIEYD